MRYRFGTLVPFVCFTDFSTSYRPALLPSSPLHSVVWVVILNVAVPFLSPPSLVVPCFHP